VCFEEDGHSRPNYTHTDIERAPEGGRRVAHCARRAHLATLPTLGRGGHVRAQGTGAAGSQSALPSLEKGGHTPRGV